jgi:signal transduction histidine kinase
MNSLKGVAPKIAFVLAYLVLGALGNYLHFASGQVILIWPAAGLAWFGLLYFGLSAWPWIFFSSFAVTLLVQRELVFTGFALALALMMASAQTLEALLGVYLFRKFSQADEAFSRLRSTILFLILSVIVSPCVGSLLGTLSLQLAKGWDRVQWLQLWQSEWLGHAMGVLIVGIFLAIWVKGPRAPLTRRRWGEALGLSIITIFFSLCAFTPFSSTYHFFTFIRAYSIYPLLIWASIRFAQKGAVTINIVISIIALDGVLMKYHLFQTNSPNEDLFIIQIYLCVVTISSLVLSAAVREAQESLELRKEFFMIASHELKTPMTSLLLQLNLVQRQLGPEFNKSIGRYIERSNQQARRLALLVEQLFDVARLEKRSIVLHPEKVDLHQLITQLADRFSKDFEAVGSRLELDLAPRIVGSWDPFRIEQALENLLSNAMKHAPGSPVLISASQRGNAVRIIFRDEGPGIAKSLQGKVFDRFVRAHPGSSAQSTPGLGLGLFITRKIIEAHHGSIRVESEPGRGTSFVIEL